MDRSNTVTIYEYKISKSTFIQVQHNADVIVDKHGKTKYSIYLKKYRRTVIYTQNELDVLHNNRIFSLSDDKELLKQKFIECYQRQITREKEKIKRYRKIIQQIKKEESK